ncbi:MAG: hypothetical protein HKN33_01585 [Pyrinomonadaceae bacterium]|nr:hypothetical protein [Pyrinomonadaceae bacterium]
MVGTISSSLIRESSGLVHSRCQENVLWTHNDSGDKNRIFAVDTKGKLIGTWHVTGARNRDWEDMSTFKDENGKCFLFVGDTGNNGRLRSNVTIYKLEEPIVTKQKGKTPATARAEAISFPYPDLRHDSEAIFVHPKSQDLYVITKRITGAAGVYRIKKGKRTAEKVTDIEVPSVPNGLITGAAISPDGERVLLCDYFGGYEFRLPEDSESFDDIWKVQGELVDLGTRAQGEAVAYSSDGLSIYATSEKRNSPLIKVTLVE